MDVNNLRLDIVNSSIKNLYILSGTEVGVRDIYINQIKDKLQIPVQYSDSYTSIRTKIKGTSLISSKTLYIILNDKEILKSENLFAELKNIKNNHIIFIYSDIDKRTKFYKEFKETIIEFTPLTEDMLVKYIKKDYPQLTPDNCIDLIKRCDGDYARICLELNKLDIYTQSKYHTDLRINESFSELKSNIFTNPDDAIFEIVEAVLKKDSKRAYDRLDNSERLGESNINILYNLYNTTKQVLQVQTSTSKDLEKATGLSKWQVKYAKEKSGFYSPNILLNIMNLIQTVDTNIKKGLIPEEVSVRYVLSRIFNQYAK